MVDFGFFKKPYFDKSRWEYVQKCLSKDLGKEINELEVKNLVVGLRPLSPDCHEIIGPMSYYPNVILNVGYGP